MSLESRCDGASWAVERLLNLSESALASDRNGAGFGAISGRFRLVFGEANLTLASRYGLAALSKVRLR